MALARGRSHGQPVCSFARAKILIKFLIARARRSKIGLPLQAIFIAFFVCEESHFWLGKNDLHPKKMKRLFFDLVGNLVISGSRFLATLHVVFGPG